MNKTAYIIITSKCNSECEYCFYRQEPERYTENKLDKKALTDLANALKKHEFDEITITGGEPLLKKDIVYHVLGQAKDSRIITNLNTNGSLLDKETIKELSFLNLSNLFLSSNFLKTKPELIDYCKQYFRTYFIHVITRSNLKELKGIMDTARINDLNLILQPAYANERNKKLFDKLSLKNISAPEFEELKNGLNDWSEASGKKDYANLITSFYLNKDRVPTFCHLAQNDIIIEANGNVVPCFHKRDLVAGNIFEENFADILNRLDSFKKGLIKAQCFGEHCISLFY